MYGGNRSPLGILFDGYVGDEDDFFYSLVDVLTTTTTGI